MRKLFTLTLLLGSLATCVGADPTDKQVLELHQRWNAAVAGANDCVVITDNEKDFAGLEIINPLRGGD